MLDVVIIDYGVGNLLSVNRAFDRCGAGVSTSSDPDIIRRASHVVLPGVGAISSAMGLLCRNGLDELVKEVAAVGTPLLGICLGMQMLLGESEEFGLTQTLNLIPGRVIPVPKCQSNGAPLKIPNIGWYGLYSSEESAPWSGTLLETVQPGEMVYFVHSFMAEPLNSRDTLAHYVYGGNALTAVVMRENVLGCQFHPEKSSEVGLRILEQFLRL